MSELALDILNVKIAQILESLGFLDPKGAGNSTLKVAATHEALLLLQALVKEGRHLRNLQASYVGGTNVYAAEAAFDRLLERFK